MWVLYAHPRTANPARWLPIVSKGSRSRGRSWFWRSPLSLIDNVRPKRNPNPLSRREDNEPASERRSLFAPATTISPPAGSAPARILNEITVLEGEPGTVSIGLWKNVIFVLWERRATAPAVARLARASTVLAEAEPEACRSTVHIILDGAGLPTPEARAGFIDLMKEHAARLVCVAVVVGGTGFLASALRSFITGMRWASPRSFDFRLHGSINEVTKWLPDEHLKRTGEPIDGQRLKQALSAWAERGTRPA
jgi:hypothetical protein